MAGGAVVTHPATVIHWLAIMFAISLVFVSEVKQMMNATPVPHGDDNIGAGTFIAGNYSSGGWRISLVGFQLALGVPAVAWLDNQHSSSYWWVVC